MSEPELKAAVRTLMRERLGKISPAVRAVESIELGERLKTQMPSASTILFFAPLADELDIWPVLELSMAVGVTCALPFFDAAKKTYGARILNHLATEIVTGKFGVREPAASCAEIALDKFDLVLVPGMAFDFSGNRLGRGRGFYDRLRPSGWRIEMSETDKGWSVRLSKSGAQIAIGIGQSLPASIVEAALTAALSGR